MYLSRSVYITAALIIMVLLPGCSEDRPAIDRTPTARIGAIYPLTGRDASAGEDLKSGIELAEQIINGSLDFPAPTPVIEGPYRRRIKLQVIFEDSKSDPKVAAALVEKLVNEEHVSALVGCYNSTVTAAASERAEIIGVPFVNAESTSPTLIQRGFKWFFRTTPDDEMFARNFFSFFSDLRDMKHIDVPKRLVLVFENQLWGTSVAMAERNLAVKFGYEVIEEIPYDPRESEFNAELQRIKSSMPAVILQASYDLDAVGFIRGYKTFDINPVGILGMNAGFSSPHFLAALGPDGEYVMSREAWTLDINRGKPIVNMVNEMFVKKTGRNMSGYSARSFTAVMVLADALNRARAFGPAEIREALLATDIKGEELIMPWDGVRFDANTGQNVLGKGIIVQVQDGLYRTIWPWDLAVRPVVWPVPPWSRGEKGTAP